MDRQEDVIRRITAHVVAYRFQLENQRIAERKELQLMALELKGLKAKAMTARANIGKLDAAYDAFNAKATTHVSDVESLAEQLGGMAEDLTFATTTLGNSVAGSNAGAAEKPKEQPSERYFVSAADIMKVNTEPPEGLQFALNPEPALGGKIDAAAEAKVTTDRVALGPHPDQPEGQQTASQQTGSASASADPRPNGADVLVRAG